MPTEFPMMSPAELIIAAPSTPSDVGYNTVQDIRSPSQYQRNLDSLHDLASELEGNTPPLSCSPPSLGQVPLRQGAFGMNFTGTLVGDDDLFERQSPAPFTAPHSPAPS
jgi:hypothetical protein